MVHHVAVAVPDHQEGGDGFVAGGEIAHGLTGEGQGLSGGEAGAGGGQIAVGPVFLGGLEPGADIGVGEAVVLEGLGGRHGSLDGGVAADGLSGGLLDLDGIGRAGDQAGQGDRGLGDLLHCAVFLSLEGVDHQPLGIVGAGLTIPGHVDAAGVVGRGRELGDGQILGGDLGADGPDHAVRGNQNGIGLAGLEVLQGGHVLGDGHAVGVAVGAGDRQGPALRGVAVVEPGQRGGGADERSADLGDRHRGNGLAGGGDRAGELQVGGVGQGDRVLGVGVQTGEGDGVAGKDRGLGFTAGGAVVDGPLLGLRAVHHKGELHLRGRGPVDGEAHNVGRGLGGGDNGSDTRNAFPLEALHGDGVLGPGGQALEDIGLAGIGLAGHVAVGVGADDFKGGGVLLGGNGHGDRVGGPLQGLDGVDGQRAGADKEEPHGRTGQGQHQHHRQDRGQPLENLFSFSRLFAGVQGQIVVGRLQGPARLVILVDVLVDGFDQGVEHLIVGGEALFKGVVHLVGIGELDGLDGLLGGVLIHRNVVGHDGRRNGRVAHLIAQHIVGDGRFQLFGRLVSILRLKGAGLCNDLGHFIVGKHGRGQCLSRDAELVGGLGRGFFILQGRVVSVVDPVENQAHGIEVDGLIDVGHQIKELRRGEGAEHSLGHGAVLEILHLGKAQVSEHKMALGAEIDIAGLHVSVDEAGLPQVREGVAQVHGQIDRAGMGHLGLQQIALQRRAVLGQEEHVEADAFFLGTDLIAAEGIQVGAGGQSLHLLQLGLIVGHHLLVVGLSRFLVGGRAGEDQGFHLPLGLRHGDVLEDVELVGPGAFDGVDAGAAPTAQTLLHLHIGQQRCIEFKFCQAFRLLQLIQLYSRRFWAKLQYKILKTA